MRVRIGVPSGIGDTYWCLTKLAAMREHYGWSHVELCVQKTSKPRALGWEFLVDMVDKTTEYPFRDKTVLEPPGWRPLKNQYLDAILWPNAVIDTGAPLSSWLPDFATDQSFEVNTPPMRPRVVLYASSRQMMRSWIPNTGVAWWTTLAEMLTREFGERPLLIGADWDRQNAESIGKVDTLVGQTSLAQCLGILRSAHVVIGMICGMTIMSTHFRTPTIALCADKFPGNFGYNWTPADAPYVQLRNEVLPQHPPEHLAKLALSLANKETPHDD